MLRRIVRLPPVLFFVFLTLGSTANVFLPLPIGLASAGCQLVAGGGLFLAAVAIAAAGLWELRRHRTPVEPWQTPSMLVTSGIYSFSRNPIYLALTVALTGFAVMFDTWWLIVSAAVLWIVLDRVVIRGEERLVGATFPEEYAAYRGRVSRWLSPVRPRKPDSR